MQQKTFSIGNIKFDNRFVLAPMAGVNCPAFMLTAKELGAGLVYTQMVYADEIIEDTDKAISKYIDIASKIKPLTIQVVSNNPVELKEATALIEDKADIIDLNLGCIEGKILGKKCGVYLMKHPEKIKSLVNAITSATNKPVTAKIRLGWDNASINMLDVGERLKNAGVNGVALHARTRKQGYSGKAAWKHIKELKNNLELPIIGNGDVTSGRSAETMFNATGCDALMVGRAAIGNPAIFKECIAYQKGKDWNKEKIINQKIKAYKLFYKYYLKQHRQSLNEFITHSCWFSKGMQKASMIKEELRKCKSIDDAYNYFIELC